MSTKCNCWDDHIIKQILPDSLLISSKDWKDLGIEIASHHTQSHIQKSTLPEKITNIVLYSAFNVYNTFIFITPFNKFFC